MQRGRHPVSLFDSAPSQSTRPKTTRTNMPRTARMASFIFTRQSWASTENRNSNSGRCTQHDARANHLFQCHPPRPGIPDIFPAWKIRYAGHERNEAPLNANATKRSPRLRYIYLTLHTPFTLIVFSFFILTQVQSICEHLNVTGKTQAKTFPNPPIDSFFLF